MSDLQDLTAAGNSSVIPGSTLSPPRLIEWAEAESEAAEQYIRNISRAAMELPEPARAHLQSRAADNLLNSPPVFGSEAFDAWATSAGAVPFLLWLSLRISEPQVTRQEAAELLAGERGETIARAVWDLWGYRAAKKSHAPAAGGDGANCSQNFPRLAAYDTTKSPA